MAKKLRSASAAEAATKAITEMTEHELEEKGQTVLPGTEKSKAEQVTTPEKKAAPAASREVKKASAPAKPKTKKAAPAKAKPAPKHEITPAPESTQKTESAPSEAEAKTVKIGQPKKYEEECKHVSFSLPLSAIENLKILSQFNGTNQTQFVLSLINEKFEENREKVEAFKKLMAK